MANKFFSVAYYPTLKDCFWKDVNNKKQSKNIEKSARFVKKNAKIGDVKMLKPFHCQWNLCSNPL